MRRIFVFFLCLCSSAVVANVNFETVTFINADGHRWVNYVTTRSNAASYTVFLDKANTLDSYLYINPNRYSFDEEAGDANRLRFAQGNYALISQGDYIRADAPEESLVTISDSGIFTLKTWNGKKLDNGHFGYWNTPTNYANFASAWVFPDHFEVVEYHTNRPGEWVQRENTLAFFSQDVNDLTFEISYKPRSQTTYSNLKQQLKDLESVAVEQDQDTVTVILENEILFASGSATLSDAGEQVIYEIGENFKDAQFEVIVEGHTDNVPITGSLADVYPTNWELSATRALNVVHALSSAGINPERLQARAFGPFRPRVPNISPANRSANRRIELVIQPLSD